MSNKIVATPVAVQKVTNRKVDLIESDGDHLARIAIPRPVPGGSWLTKAAANKAEFIALALNTHDALLEFYRASRAWGNTIGHPDATAEDENKAEARYDAAMRAASEALAAAGVA